VGGTIFISYRRGQDAGFAGRLFDRLERTFRRKALFMDVDSIAPGQDFVSILEARVAECDVLLALIGRGWLTATDEAGRRRLDNPEDFVRIEIATALAQAKRVIPVLIDDVPMPRSEDLPEILRPLVRRQATRLSHDRFKADSDRLIRALKQVLVAAETARQESATQREARQQALTPTPDAISGPQEGHSTPRPRERVKVARHPPSRAEAIKDFAAFRDIDAPWCPEMVALPAGEFLMGSPEDEKERLDHEGPQHRVAIGRRFVIGRYAVEKLHIAALELKLIGGILSSGHRTVK
jgi:TIR domain/Sulfatase-modifying factor enzyme 1